MIDVFVYKLGTAYFAIFEWKHKILMQNRCTLGVVGAYMYFKTGSEILLVHQAILIGLLAVTLYLREINTLTSTIPIPF
jgi:hypothetical protein